jgi:hypothetical protein
VTFYRWKEIYLSELISCLNNIIAYGDLFDTVVNIIEYRD